MLKLQVDFHEIVSHNYTLAIASHNFHYVATTFTCDPGIIFVQTFTRVPLPNIMHGEVFHLICKDHGIKTKFRGIFKRSSCSSKADGLKVKEQREGHIILVSMYVMLHHF